eukprot:145602-Prorocentrum_minimum.AAC.1
MEAAIKHRELKPPYLRLLKHGLVVFSGPKGGTFAREVFFGYNIIDHYHYDYWLMPPSTADGGGNNH